MSESFVSYAQNFEDVRLWRAFRDIDAGRYLDIGTQDPVRDSVSLAFYERGWRGVHVEPTPTYAAAIRSARPDETVIEAAVSTAPGPIAFYEIPETGISTGIAEIAQRHSNAGWASNRITVPTVTLAGLFGLMGDEAIHWLKIDVEGMEADVLRSWGDHPARPAALVIEATAPNSTIQTHDAWYDLVLTRGYRDVLFDGLSRYFVHETYAERGAALALSPNVFDGFHVTLSHFSTGHLADERDRAVKAAALQGEAERDAAVEKVRHDLEARLSAAELGLSEERAAHIAQQGKALDLVREAGRLEGQLAAQADHSAAQAREAEATRRALIEQLSHAADIRAAAQAREAEAMRRELLDQLAQAGSERAAAKVEVADLRVRIETLSGEHALAMAKGEWALEKTQGQVATLQAELEKLHAQLAASAQHLASAAGLLAGPADGLAGWPRRVATVLARLAGRKPDEVSARYAAQVAVWRAAQSPSGMITPEWREFPLAHRDPVAELVVDQKDIQMFSDEGPITTVPRLLAPHDADFIRSAYEAVLGRAPDQEGGAYYLSRLRGGAHKLEILKQLRRSDEGRRFIPGVAGLDRAIKRHRRANLPIVGAVFRLATGAESNGATHRQLRMLGNEMARVRAEQLCLTVLMQQLAERTQTMSHQISSIPAQSSPQPTVSERMPPKLDPGPMSQGLDSQERRLVSNLRLFARTHGGFA